MLVAGHALATPAERFGLYVGGQWCQAADGRRIEVINPANEEVLASVPYGGQAEARRALEAAAAAGPGWRELTAYDRGALLRRAGELTRERCDEIALLMSLEEGKTLAGARAEVLQAAATLDWFAEEGKRVYGRIVPPSVGSKRLWVLHQPIGVVAAVTPWNFPIALQSRKLGAALAAGCTTVSRPASGTPLCTMAWFSCLHEAGFPPGVINLVAGPPDTVVGEFIDHPVCRKISFTGSTAVGKELLQRCAPQLKKLELELGGHAPVLVFPDVDVAAAAKECVVGKFRNMGQVCISPTRFYVHRSIREEFTAAVVAAVQQLKLGDPLTPGCEAGPLFERRNVESVERFVADAVAKGARVLAGGRRPPGFDRGYWYEPTVLDQIDRTMRLTCEEVFGPILPLLTFDTVDEVLAAANDTTYGLAAYVLTRDLSTAIRCAEGLEYGIIGLNDPVPATPQMPFGGMKESGLGREMGAEGIYEYLETKMVSVGL
ncbi:MAG: NAD-dependent succinate-semialdehyde dehydrogenase [Fimbriimonadaceae bacterium]|nr:NAD-dependent succinate-semialdehyde dehydrogenase [Fimbriimonadaceae bacterium]